MISKEQRVQLWWARVRSGGKARYLWRCSVVDGIGQGALVYLLVHVCDLLFGWQPSLPFAGDLECIVVWLLTYAFVSYFLGLMLWERYERKYQALLPKTMNTDSLPNNLPNSADPV